MAVEVNQDLILKLEKLSKLRLSPEERISIQKDLIEMLDMIDKLNELNLEDVQALTHLSTQTNVWRDDKVGEHSDRKSVLENAPKSDGVFFKVPKVIKK